jgi:putative Holliday junction resolvase
MPEMGRVMGVDVGSVRVGIALSDESGLIAQPFQTIRRESRKGTVAAIGRLAKESGVSRIVVGLPLSMDGSEQATSDDARKLAGAIESETGLEVQVWDERLTTAQAERLLIEGNVRRNKRKEVVDRIAAAVMLQSFLDHHFIAGETPSSSDPPGR